jgi:hypothetical protein
MNSHRRDSRSFLDFLIDSPESESRYVLHEDPDPGERRLRPGLLVGHFVAFDDVERRPALAGNHQLPVTFQTEHEAAGAVQRGLGRLPAFGRPQRLAARQVDAVVLPTVVQRHADHHAAGKHCITREQVHHRSAFRRPNVRRQPWREHCTGRRRMKL